MNPGQPGPADAAAIEYLTHLAAELTQRGHNTQLTTTPPPHLTLHHPSLPHPCRIYIQNGWLCWHDPSRPYDPAPFTLRSTPPGLAADRAQNVLKVFVTAYHITHAPPTPGPDPPAVAPGGQVPPARDNQRSRRHLQRTPATHHAR